MASHQLTISQQVWLAAWTAAIQSGKYNPKEEADSCLVAFSEKFLPSAQKQVLLEEATVNTQNP